MKRATRHQWAITQDKLLFKEKLKATCTLNFTIYAIVQRLRVITG
jgi:hypothetical protein